MWVYDNNLFQNDITQAGVNWTCTELLLISVVNAVRPVLFDCILHINSLVRKARTEKHFHIYIIHNRDLYFVGGIKRLSDLDKTALEVSLNVVLILSGCDWFTENTKRLQTSLALWKPHIKSRCGADYDFNCNIWFILTFGQRFMRYVSRLKEPFGTNSINDFFLHFTSDRNNVCYFWGKPEVRSRAQIWERLKSA